MEERIRIEIKYENKKKINNPVVIYKDLNFKHQILNENKGKVGVYCFTNTKNGKTYIGIILQFKKKIL